jgi:peptidoglycan glycosyltransferase
MMQTVVQSGTGTAAQIPGIAVAGKTGTAQHGGPAPYTWFISFAPAANPQVAVAVVVENTDPHGTGGTVAAPIAKQVMEAAIGG